MMELKLILAILLVISSHIPTLDGGSLSTCVVSFKYFPGGIKVGDRFRLKCPKKFALSPDTPVITCGENWPSSVDFPKCYSAKRPRRTKNPSISRIKRSKSPSPPCGGDVKSLGAAYEGTLPSTAFSTNDPRLGGNNNGPEKGRLNHPAYRCVDSSPEESCVGFLSWHDISSTTYHLQVDLGETKTITSLSTQGGGSPVPHYVTKYKVQTGNDENALSFIQDASGTADKEFVGNVDAVSTVTVELDKPVQASIIRFVPTGSNSFTSMYTLRVDILGCDL